VENFLVLFVRSNPEPHNFVAFGQNADRAITPADGYRHKTIRAVNVLEMKTWVPRIAPKEFVRIASLLLDRGWK
jgi:hypothetical protein